MLQEYFKKSLEKAIYEHIDKGKRYYGEIPGFRGVWAAGIAIEECRSQLLEALEGWVILRLRRNLPIPGFTAKSVTLPRTRSKVYA